MANRTEKKHLSKKATEQLGAGGGHGNGSGSGHFSCGTWMHETVRDRYDRRHLLIGGGTSRSPSNLNVDAHALAEGFRVVDSSQIRPSTLVWQKWSGLLLT